MPGPQEGGRNGGGQYTEKYQQIDSYQHAGLLLPHARRGKCHQIMAKEGDGVIDLADYEVMYDCLLGPDVAIEREACCTFDFEPDDDVDIEDAAAFAVSFDG